MKEITIKKEVPITKRTKTVEIKKYQDLENKLHNTKKSCLKSDEIINTNLKILNNFNSSILNIGIFTTITKLELTGELELLKKRLYPFNEFKSSKSLKLGIYYFISTIKSTGSYDPDYEHELLTEQEFKTKYLTFFNS